MERHDPEPIHSLPQATPTSVADRLLLPVWLISLTAYLLWLLTLGVNV